MHRLAIKTHKKREVIDITQKLEAVLWKQYEDKTGVCQLSLLHTTAALTTADLDPAPISTCSTPSNSWCRSSTTGTSTIRKHVPDHILSAMIGTSVSLMVRKRLTPAGYLAARVLIELDGPRERELVIALAETA